MTHKRDPYDDPPIEEALVEFRFAPGQDWDLTIPGKLHEKLKSMYSGKPRHQKLVQASLQAEAGQPVGFAVHEDVARVQLVDSIGQRLVSLGPNVLSVNVLRPYEGWDSFKPRVDDAVRAYAAVTGAEKVGRIGVRYINKVVVPDSRADFRQYFRCGPTAPSELPARINGFVSRAEHVFEDEVKLLLTFASIDAQPETSAFLLDLDVVWENETAIDINSALERVNDLHEREGMAFEAVITDKAREVFGGT